MNDEVRTPLEELSLTDRFLFAETMDEPEAYEAMVGILLENEITLAGYPQTEKELRVSPGLRAVRLDVVSIDREGRIYFTEMQKTNSGNLIKRSRYYQAQLDVSLLEPGCSDFNRLNDSCLVLVSPFELFGYGLYRYTFRGQCQEVPGLALRDGADRVFINTHGTNREDFSQEFLDFMEYINDTREEVAVRNGSIRLQTICDCVERVRRSEKCGVKYMQRWEEIEYARQDGYAEGRMLEVIRAVCRKLVKGKDVAQIAEELEKEPEDIARICRVAERYAPAYDQDAICRELLKNAV